MPATIFFAIKDVALQRLKVSRTYILIASHMGVGFAKKASAAKSAVIDLFTNLVMDVIRAVCRLFETS